MAKFSATFSDVVGIASGIVPENALWARAGPRLRLLKGRTAEGLTNLVTSGVSQVMQRGGADWTAPRDGVLTMRGNGDVWVDIGPTPVAAPDVRFFVGANERQEIAVVAGDKIAVVDAVM